MPPAALCAPPRASPRAPAGAPSAGTRSRGGRARPSGAAGPRPRSMPTAGCGRRVSCRAAARGRGRRGRERAGSLGLAAARAGEALDATPKAPHQSFSRSAAV
eukprot:11192627-Lingulodinium_polyedra.AAC.1